MKHRSIFWCPVPVSVRTKTQTYRETYQSTNFPPTNQPTNQPNNQVEPTNHQSPITNQPTNQPTNTVCIARYCHLKNCPKQRWCLCTRRAPPLESAVSWASGKTRLHRGPGPVVRPTPKEPFTPFGWPHCCGGGVSTEGRGSPRRCARHFADEVVWHCVRDLYIDQLACTQNQNQNQNQFYFRVGTTRRFNSDDDQISSQFRSVQKLTTPRGLKWVESQKVLNSVN